MAPHPSLPDEVVIRDAGAGEREAIARLTRRAYAELSAAMAPDAWTALDAAISGALASDAGAEWIVAEHGGGLVGSVMLFPPSAAAYGAVAAKAKLPELRLLAVAPEARGLGVGEALVRECMARARHTGARALGLHTSASMRAARRLYERLGFVRAPETDFRPDGAELVEGYTISLESAVRA